MPAHALSERAARAALAAHFAPGQLAAELDEYTPAEVWDRRVRSNGSGLLASYRPSEELAQAERRPLAGPLKDQETPYLFPGLRPSRPLSSNTLQRRLQRLGVPSASKARNGAWLALVGAVHWKMLADLLGAADGTAHSWHKWNGGDRASYVASRLRAAQAPTSPE
ncbi:hypothetical protein ACIP6Q_32260 [Streptomyces bobili]|uniref:hypothetical protein n=1 Tax=Streptomyces bobili TaxID=67280 RepID=UPI003811F802